MKDKIAKVLQHEKILALREKITPALKKLDVRISPFAIPLGASKQVVISAQTLLQSMIAVLCFYLALFFIVVAQHNEAFENIDSQFSKASVDISAPNLPEQNERLTQRVGGSSHNALPRVPIRGLFEEGPYGLLPKIDLTHKTTPFENYRRDLRVTGGDAPLISLVMLDYAISPRLSERALQILPEDVSVVLSPYARAPDDYLKIARHDGHEVWLQLPLEKNTFPDSDPGPQAILSRASLRFNIDQLEWHLGRGVGYAGVFIESDDVFDNAEPMFRSLIREVYDRGLVVVEGHVQGYSTIPPKMADLLQTPYLKVDLNLNSEKSRANRNQAFEILETIASAKGHAVATFEPHPETLLALDLWIRSFEGKGLRLAPLSATVGDFELTPAMVRSVTIRQEQNAESKRIVEKTPSEGEEKGESEKGGKDEKDAKGKKDDKKGKDEH